MKDTQTVLPPLLEKLIREGRWSSSAADLSIVPIDDARELQLLDEVGIAKNTHSLKRAYEDGQAALFRLVNTTPPPGFLDVRAAVVIGVTYGQDLLVLDYSKPEPRVVTLTDNGWITVAETFDEFAARVGLK